MSKILIVDTSVRSTLLVAENEGAVKVIDRVPAAGENTSKNIIPLVDEALASVGLTMGDLDLVAVAVGPGSFTGLRIGVSVVNAFGTTGVKLLGVNLLEMLLEGEDDQTTAALPSRAGYCYTDKGEMSVEEVAALDRSVGVEGTGAKTVLKREAYASRLHTYVKNHAGEAATEPVAPLYLKKSQAERLRENRKDGD